MLPDAGEWAQTEGLDQGGVGVGIIGHNIIYLTFLSVSDYSSACALLILRASFLLAYILLDTSWFGFLN